MILDRIVAAKRARNLNRPSVSLDALLSDALTVPHARSLAYAIENPDREWPHVIAEFKRRSPSAGSLQPNADPSKFAALYAKNGARAMSILTDEPFFGGRLMDIAGSGATIPILRKDFLLDERDVVESRLAGADAVLLIVRILPAEDLRRLLALTHQLGMDALVETHHTREIELALAEGARIIGINHRDLDTLKIDLSLSKDARKQVGPEGILVGESGIHTRADVEKMRAAEVDAILVGEAILRAESPAHALSELIRPCS